MKITDTPTNLVFLITNKDSAKMLKSSLSSKLIRDR